ncbi:MAG: methyltransferase domain-containing protein [Candidatus Zixiibacteriota bacterium]|nr:MAG: methyltransferase domain-containing protein [candidate division Zixibacteria bacterium]
MAKKDAGWWDEFFPAFRPIFDKMPRRTTNAEVRFIIKKLNLRSGRKFLDCPCGIGRIALPMARQGIKVTGVDITESYLEELARKARARGLRLDLHRADMRRIDFDSQFDAAGNLWTSFGYFKKESDNLLVLKNLFKALKPGGKFMLHIINRDWIMANFEATDWYNVGDMKVLENRGFDFATSTSIGTWTFIRKGQERSYDNAIRMYSYHELLDMFRKVGFIDIEGWGSEKEEPISLRSRMMFVVGTRPGR